jgi:hypothetical protein
VLGKLLAGHQAFGVGHLHTPFDLQYVSAAMIQQGVIISKSRERSKRSEINLTKPQLSRSILLLPGTVASLSLCPQSAGQLLQ